MTATKSDVKTTFIEKLSNDVSIDWEFNYLAPRSLILDTLYLLGVSIDKKYSGYLGFKKFLEENNVNLNLTEISNNERTR